MKATTAPMYMPLPPEPPRPGRLTLWPWLLFPLAVILVACLGGCTKPPVLVNQYILEYPAPVVGRKAKLPADVKVELFSVAQTFNTQAMVYQPRPYQSQTYNYSRWRANPGYLVTDYLIRDLRESGLFKAVFGPDSSGEHRFKLEGGVAEFQEVDAADGWKASLALTVTLLDTTQQELPQRVVFQKNYRVLEPLPEKTPQGLAQGMSRAMEQISAQIIHDTYEAARQRTAGK
jgi:cholesterol transport system auxiliary component